LFWKSFHKKIFALIFHFDKLHLDIFVEIETFKDFEF